MEYFLTIEREIYVASGSFDAGELICTSKWIPDILEDLGILQSRAQLRRNRPDLWREYKQGELIKYGRRLLRLYHAPHINPNLPID